MPTAFVTSEKDGGVTLRGESGGTLATDAGMSEKRRKANRCDGQHILAGLRYRGVWLSKRPEPQQCR